MTDQIKPEKEVQIFLSASDADAFIQFQKYYLDFMLLIDKGVFDQKNAAVTLHFDKDGILQTIQRADFLYSRKHES